MKKVIPANAKPRDPKDFVPVVTTLLKGMIAERRTTYARASELIAANYAKGEPRRGRPKLRLTLDELVMHEGARIGRRQAHRELKVLVRLLHRVSTGAQQNDNFDIETSPTLNALKLALSPFVHGKGKQVKYEKPLALLFLTAFPAMFLSVPLPDTSSTPIPAPVRPLTGACQAKLALYNKVTSAGILTGPEIAALRDVFWN